jgi:hypothetical protein
MLRRCSDRHGEPDGGDDVLDCVQERKGGTAGGAQAQVSFGLWMIASISCEIG